MGQWNIPARTVTAAAVLLVTACTDRPGEDDDDASSSVGDPSGSTDPTAETTAVDDAWFDIGWGIEAFAPLQDGDTLEVVWGTQGAAMFPLPLRGGGFVLPNPPSDYSSELAPLFDLHIDIDGHNDGIGGHFMYLANYPITFEIQADGSYEFVYVAALLPDAVDPTTLQGLEARVFARLRPYDAEPLEREITLVVDGGEPPG
jgi:hypothetical protein